MGARHHMRAVHKAAEGARHKGVPTAHQYVDTALYTGSAISSFMFLQGRQRPRQQLFVMGLSSWHTSWSRASLRPVTARGSRDMCAFVCVRVCLS